MVAVQERGQRRDEHAVHPLYALTHDVGFFAAFESLFKYHLGQLLAAVVFGVVLLIAVRVIKRLLVIPA